MTEPLSPAAQAVLDGFRAVPTLMDGPSIAGALRAAADQVVPENLREYETYTNEAIRLNRMHIRSRLLAIAAELEGGND
jgi:hypothetical protein